MHEKKNMETDHINRQKSFYPHCYCMLKSIQSTNQVASYRAYTTLRKICPGYVCLNFSPRMHTESVVKIEYCNFLTIKRKGRVTDRRHTLVPRVGAVYKRVELHFLARNMIAFLPT
jgi:hypothetical protein